ncbi:hypothetical protein ACOMHN_028813 [Nucella lapillus]
MAETGAQLRLEHGRDWSMAETETGAWQRLEHCRDWSMAETGAQQRLEHGRDWSMAETETGARQRLITESPAVTERSCPQKLVSPGDNTREALELTQMDKTDKQGMTSTCREQQVLHDLNM